MAFLVPLAGAAGLAAAGGAATGAVAAGTAADIGLAASAVGTVASAAGAAQSASAQASAANFQAQVARNNQTTAYQNAEYATQAGQEKANEESIAARGQLGAVRAAEAASGVDVNSGSAADVQETQRETGSLNTLQTVDNANLQAYGYRTQAANFGSTAGLESATAANANAAAPLQIGTSLLSGASSLGANFVKLQQSGVWGAPASYDPAP